MSKGKKSRKQKRKQIAPKSKFTLEKRKKAFKPKLIHAMNKLKTIRGSRRIDEVIHAPKKLIHDMSHALHVTRHCNVKLPSTLMKKVKQNAKALRKFSNPRSSMKSKRDTIRQYGDGLVDTITKLIPTAGYIIASLLA